MPLRRIAENSALQNLRRSPRLAALQNLSRIAVAAPKPSPLDAAKAKARADMEARIKARVEQLGSPKNSRGTKEYFISTIRSYLNLIANIRYSDARIATSTGLMNFIYTEAISFVKEHPKFHNTIVNKCYNLKRAVHLLCKDTLALTEACNKVLVALGQPLEQTLRPETMSKQDLINLIEQLIQYKERALA